MEGISSNVRRDGVGKLRKVVASSLSQTLCQRCTISEWPTDSIICSLDFKNKGQVVVARRYVSQCQSKNWTISRRVPQDGHAGKSTIIKAADLDRLLCLRSSSPWHSFFNCWQQPISELYETAQEPSSASLMSDRYRSKSLHNTILYNSAMQSSARCKLPRAMCGVQHDRASLRDAPRNCSLVHTRACDGTHNGRACGFQGCDRNKHIER